MYKISHDVRYVNNQNNWNISSLISRSNIDNIWIGAGRYTQCVNILNINIYEINIYEKLSFKMSKSLGINIADITREILMFFWKSSVKVTCKTM